MDLLTIPNGLGVNIHFTDPRPGEIRMLAEAGFQWVRMDFVWEDIEKEPGRYDFSAYERLLAALSPHGIHALFILDYSNKFYDDGLAPHTDAGREAFARWAAASVKHFQGRGILWEMWNEPNLKQFWKPEPNVADYSKLALEVGNSIQAVAPEEAYIGPAVSRLDMPFLEGCFQAGLLKYWSAVTVHPYRGVDPESPSIEYDELRRMIAHYKPAGKRIPIFSAEWGYSDVSKDMTVERQGQILVRQFLNNLLNEVPLSIWYDWQDDGTDPKEKEHHFGTVFHTYHEGRDPVYDPKPAYLAARKLTTALNGYRLARRLPADDPGDYILEFRKGDAVKYAVWTRSRTPRHATLNGRPIELTDTPRYL